jgi:predicted ATPase
MNNGDAETRNLEKITLSGYKSIRGAELALGPVNILIGANGSGKSNFISVFSLFNALAQGKLQSWVKRNGGAERLLHFSSRTTDSAVIDLAFADDGYHVELKKEINDNTVFVDSEFYRPGPSAPPVGFAREKR